MKKIVTILLIAALTILYSSCRNPQNEQTDNLAVHSEINTQAQAPDKRGNSGATYIITDYYDENGAFSDLGLALDEVDSEKVLIINAGETFIIGDRKYIVMAESLSVSFYTQSSINEVLQWWADYIEIWEESGVISVYGENDDHAVISAAPPADSAETDEPPGNSIDGSGDNSTTFIYVSPNGNDAAATGSFDKPYKSINTALESAKPGDTIILCGGTYREGVNVRVRTPNITIKSQDGEWAVIDLTTHDSGADEDSGVYFDVDSSGGKLQRVEVAGGFYAVCMDTKWDWGDPADRAGASNIIIEDCVLHDSKYDVVKVKPNCDNITIRNNEIYNSGRAFIGNPANGEDNAEGIDNVNGDNMTVQNNYIHDIRGNGIYAKGGATGALIENNRIENVYGGGILVGFDTSPEFFDIAVNPRYYENISGVVRNNLIINIGWEGIGFYGSRDAQVYNNTLINVANGGLYHSAIYFGLTYQDWEDYAGRPANVNPNIHHNIVCQPSDIVRPMIEIRYADELGGMSALDGNPSMRENCYYIAGKSAVFTDNRPGSILENAGLSAWQTHIGGDSGSLETDPALGGDYMPTNTQCAGMGISQAIILK